MALKDFVASRLSAPAGRVLDAPIRDIVHEILKEAGYASPAEIQSLRDEIRDMSRQFDALRQQSGELARQLKEARAGDDPRVARIEARLDALSTSLDARLILLESGLESTKTALPGGRAGSQSADQTINRLDALDARIAAFPGVVEQRLAPIEARLALLPAEIETRIEESQLRLQAEKEAAPQAIEPPPAAVEPEGRTIQVVRAVGDTLTLSISGAISGAIGGLLGAIDTAAGAIGAGADDAIGAGADDAISAGADDTIGAAADTSAATSTEPARPPAPAEAKHDCRHPGCDQPVRARGFCGSHYQQWRRGGLRGYVTIDGSVVIGGPDGEETRNVGTNYSGLPCELRDGQIYVDGVRI